MAEVSVLSPSSDPGPVVAAAAVVDNVVDVNIEDEVEETGGVADSGSTPGTLQQPDSDRQLGPDDLPTIPEMTAGMKRRATDDEPDGDGQSNSRKRRGHRRKHKAGRNHPKWKPYTKLTWEEKKTLEERESRRAVQKRQQMAASGQPMAPYNTTQFLMEQHEPQDADMALEDPPTRAGRSEGSGSMESSDEYYDSPNDEHEIFLEKDFTEAYETFHAERLQAMTKGELVQEHLQLEAKVEKLEHRLKDMGENNCDSESDSKSTSGETAADARPKTQTPESLPEMSAASKLRLEIQRLREQNGKLIKENHQLRTDDGSKS